MPSRRPTLKNVPALKPGQAYFVIGDRCWGRGLTVTAALKNARAAGGGTKKYVVYIGREDVYVESGMGDWMLPDGADKPEKVYQNF